MAKKKSNKKEYSTAIYCYDIETSPVEQDGERLQSTYLHGLSRMVYQPMSLTSFEEAEKGMSYTYYRSYESISDAFEGINQLATVAGVYVKVFVHNLSYEFEAMMRNIRFCYENFSSKRFIAVAPHQPLVVVCDRLEFYDSLKILGGKSLGQIGKEYNIPKLTDIKGGYNQKYYWWSTLPESEIIYNRRDCNLVLYAICRYMSNFTDVNSVKDICVSNTSLIKREIRMNREIATIGEVERAQEFAREELKNNTEFIKLMQTALAGGYTHANPYVVGKHITNVVCYDAVSMHPSAMWGRLFGYHWQRASVSSWNRLRAENLNWMYGGNKTVEQNALSNDDILRIVTNESLLFEQPIKNFYIATVKFTDVEAREFPNCLYAYISSSKCSTLEGGEYDNGKVYKAKELTFTGCCIDFLLIDILYSYGSAECVELVEATTVSRMQKPSRNGVHYYAKQKSGYKQLEKKLHDGTATIKDTVFNGVTLYQKEVAERVLLESDEYMCHTSLMAAKAGLNGQYGCNAMKPLRAEVGVHGYGGSFDWDDLGEQLLEGKSSLNVFTDGLYTVAYSRLHLICFALYLVLKCGVIPLYHDTDSIYFTNNSEEAVNAVKAFNDNILASSWAGECYNFGLMDDDGHYNDFTTWGSKCYCATYTDKDGNTKVKATVAGATKTELSGLFTEVVKYGGFDYLIREYFHPNISYDESINKKLLRKTPGTLISGKFVDEYGVEGTLHEFSVTVLEECGYTLRALNSIVIRYYYDFCYGLRGERFPEFPPETVSIYKGDYATFTKRFSTQQYETYCEAPASVLFQAAHEHKDKNNEIS